LKRDSSVRAGLNRAPHRNAGKLLDPQPPRVRTDEEHQ
jgi:hypothetical protein